MMVPAKRQRLSWRPIIRFGFAVFALPVIAAAADPRTGDIEAGNFSGSLSQDQDRFAESTLRAAQTDFQKGDVGSGVRRLQDLFDRQSDSLVLLDGVYRPVFDAAGRLLLEGNDDRRETYERIFGPIAEQELRKAMQSDDRSAIERVAQRFRYTAAGREAAMYLAALALDEGNLDAAIERWRSVTGDDGTRGDRENAAGLIARLERLIRIPNDSATSAVDTRELNTISEAPSSLTNVRWRADVPMTEAARQEIAASLSELDAQAILPLLSAKPLVKDGVAYSRRLGGITAVDVRSGNVLWECAIPNGMSRLVTEPVDFGNRVRRSSSTALFLERLVRSSLTDHLTCDGSRVFAVIPASPPWTNTLVALSAENGELLWTAGADLKWTGPVAASPGEDESAQTPPTRLPHDPALDEVFFMGPPQTFGEWRLVIGQRESIVSLYAIEANEGTLGWSVPLGRAVRTLEEDRPRHGTACPVTLRDGRAYCPTAAGCLACVDVRSQRLLWAFRYPRDDLPRVSHDEESGRADTTHATHMPTRSVWHEVFLSISDDVLLLASPDSDRLYALDATSGQQRWTAPRDGGVFVAGPMRGRVVVIGTSTATARTVEEGNVVWRTEIARPAGTGVATESAYVLPTQRGGLQSVHWDDGQTLLHEVAPIDAPAAVIGDRRVPVLIHPPSKLPPVRAHNLVAADEDVLVQSFTGLAAVRLHPDEDSASSSPELASSSDGKTTDAPELDDWWKGLEQSEWPGPLEPIRSVVRTIRPTLGAVEMMFTSIRQLAPLVQSPDERVAALVTELAASLEGDSNSTGGLSPSSESLLKRLKRQPLDDLFVALTDPRRSVRIDHWLSHGFVEMTTADASLRRSYLESVAALVPDSRPSIVATDNDSAHHKWPVGTPEISEHPSRGVRYVDTVPLTVVRESPWEEVTIQIDRQQQNLWFYREDVSSPVSIPLLPPRGGQLSSDFLRAWADGPVLCLRVGTDLYGFEMSSAGTLPTSPSWPQDRNARSIAGARSPLAMGLSEVSDAPQPLWDDSIPGFFDIFSRPIGVVGPFRAGYLCYQVRGYLVAIDPLTGRELWCRSEVPAGTYCVGDDEHIVLLRDEGKTVEVLRSTDGALVGEWEWANVFPATDDPRATFSHMVAVNGTCGVWHSHPPQLQENDPFAVRPGEQAGDSITVGIDLVTGRRLWSQDLETGSWVFTIDQRLLGTLSPDGDLVMRDWRSGEAVAEHSISVPRRLTKVLTFTDAEKAYIVASDRPDDRQILGARQSRGGDRRPIVNGWMHAFSRGSAEHLWDQQLDNVGMAIDPIRHVPLLVTGFMKRYGSASDYPVGVLHCYDKRTGELLFEKVQQHPVFFYHTVRAEADENRVIVETKPATIRFQYQSGEQSRLRTE